jgi:hypothetical protein
MTNQTNQPKPQPTVINKLKAKTKRKHVIYAIAGLGTLVALTSFVINSTIGDTK